MKYKTIDSLPVEKSTVFLRVDFNVSMAADGTISDDTRIRAALPTIQKLRDMGAKVVLASHFGRPKGQRDKKYSLLPVAGRLAELLEIEVLFPEDCVGMEVKKLISEAREDKVILLENLRFHPEEEANDEAFAEQLADLADVYVTDAFGALHREHASTVGMVKHFEHKGIGYLVQKEVSSLSRLLTEPEHPFIAVLGGAKVSDKIQVIESLMSVVDAFVIGGGMAYTFLKAQGYDVGSSLVEDSKLGLAKKMLERAKIKGVDFLLPLDHSVGAEFKDSKPLATYKNGDDWQGAMGLDIGPQTIEAFSDRVAQAKMVFWNGPMGVFEFSHFAKGTLAMAKVMADSEALTVVGGGDSLAAIQKSGFAEEISHLSTGGGASLKFLEGQDLPGLKVLL